MSAACAACRRLKMKCVGFDHPPCERCAKAGRDCLRQIYVRNRDSGRSRASRGPGSVSASGSASAPASASVVVDRSSPIHVIRRPQDWLMKDSNDSNLPSIYSTSPLLTVLHHASPSDATPDVTDRSLSKRRKVDASEGEHGVSQRDMVELIQFASKKLLVYIPILPKEDLEDPTRVITEKDDLALCICYVAARFLPGGNAIRGKLLPSISRLVQMRFAPSRGGDDFEITRLQSFAVLYVFRPATSSLEAEALSHWRLKAVVEAYAMHLNCHRSVNELRRMIREQNSNITASNTYRQYIIWLWLFTMSQHVSLVTGQPPSIVEDMTIRLASETLTSLSNSDAITRVLGEVEICLLWSKASIKDRGLGEWWCQVDSLDNESSTMADMRDVDAVLESWHQRWEEFMAHDYARGVLEFHFRFAKFCISTYSTRNLMTTEQQLQINQQQLIHRSVAAATSFCTLLTDLGPVMKEESVRYLADFGFVMVSFCCLFILRSCETFGRVMTDLLKSLDVVGEAAQMMKDVAVDDKHGPALYGQMLSTRLEKFRSANSMDVNYSEYDSPSQWEAGLVPMDPLWEFTTFLQDSQFDPAMI